MYEPSLQGPSSQDQYNKTHWHCLCFLVVLYSYSFIHCHDVTLHFMVNVFLLLQSKQVFPFFFFFISVARFLFPTLFVCLLTSTHLFLQKSPPPYSPYLLFAASFPPHRNPCVYAKKNAMQDGLKYYIKVDTRCIDLNQMYRDFNKPIQKSKEPPMTLCNS